MSFITLGLTETRGNPLDNPTISLQDPSAIAWFDSHFEVTESGEFISDHNALQISTVFTCVNILASSIASLPCVLYEKTASGRKEAITSSLYDLLSSEPNDEMTAFTFWHLMVSHLALTGNSYAQIQRDNSGSPIGFWPLHPHKTEPKRTADGRLVYLTQDGMENGQSRIIESADILAIPLFTHDGICGISPISLAKQGLGLAKAAEKYGAKVFGTGSRPGGILSTSSTLDSKQQESVKTSWESAQGGRKQGSTAVLPGDWKYTAVGISPDEAQFLETRKYQRADIAALFGIPPHMVGDTSRLSNANHEQESLNFVTNTLRPYLVRVEAEIKRKLLPTTGRKANKYFVKFDERELLRGDFASTMAGYATGRQWGWYSANDVRREIGENPIGTSGDVYMIPVNMANADVLLGQTSLSANQPEQEGSGNDVPE